MTAKEIGAAMGLSRDAVSKYLQRLREKGILQQKNIYIRDRNGIGNHAVVYWIESQKGGKND